MRRQVRTGGSMWRARPGGGREWLSAAGLPGPICIGDADRERGLAGCRRPAAARRHPPPRVNQPSGCESVRSSGAGLLMRTGGVTKIILCGAHFYTYIIAPFYAFLRISALMYTFTRGVEVGIPTRVDRFSNLKNCKYF